MNVIYIDTLNKKQTVVKFIYSQASALELYQFEKGTIKEEMRNNSSEELKIN